MAIPDRLAGLPHADSELDGSPPDQSTSLMQRARRGALWTGASALVLRLGNVLMMVIVARIISPAELGVYALAIAVYGFVVCLAAWGVCSAIGRSDLDADELGSTVTTFALCSSLLTAGMMVAFAGWLASALGVPEAATPIRILAITVFFTGLFAVPTGQNQRAFRQDVVFRADMIAFVAMNAALLLLVQVIPGAEAFAWSRVVGHLIVGVVVTCSLDKRYRPGWRRRYILPLLRFGVPAALGSVLAELVRNIDYVIIGREMTTADLGSYMLAFNVASWPTAVLGAVVAQIVLPAFSAVRRDGGDLRLTVARSVRSVGLVACPIAAFTCVFAYPLIETLYGRRWLEAAPVLAILAVFGVFFVLGMVFDNIMIAAGRTMVMFGVQALALIVLIPALMVGVRLGGLVGVGIGHTAVILLVTMPAYALALLRITGAGIGVVLRALSRPTLGAVLAAAVATAGTHGIDQPILTLAVAGVVGLAVYLAVVGSEFLQLMPTRIAEMRLLVLATAWPEHLSARIRDLRTGSTRL